MTQRRDLSAQEQAMCERSFVANQLAEEEAVYFLRELRAARTAALDDAENAGSLLTAFERLGYHLKCPPNPTGLGDYRQLLLTLASRANGADAIARDAAGTTATDLFDSVQVGRNEHMHVGVSARRLVDHSLRFALLLEAGLMADLKLMKHFMVADPLCAERWQTVALIRQQMLLHQFSFLPYREVGGQWKLIADHNVAAYLRSAEDRGEALAKKLSEVAPAGKLRTIDAETFAPTEPVGVILREGRAPTQPVLVVEGPEKTLRGILTPFDLL